MICAGCIALVFGLAVLLWHVHTHGRRGRKWGNA